MCLRLTSRLAEYEHELLLLPPQDRPERIGSGHDGGFAGVPERYDNEVLNALILSIPKHLEMERRGSAGDIMRKVEVEE